MNIIDQINSINPSDKEALFRRLMIEADLAYLRQKNKIVGFEVVTHDNYIPGVVVTALQKHTILAMSSDLDEEPKLIIFPDILKSEDPEFELSEIKVIRKVYDDASFEGVRTEEREFGILIQDLLPPKQNVELIVEDSPTESTARPQAESKPKPHVQPKPVENKKKMLETTEKIAWLEDQQFTSMDAVTNFSIIKLAIDGEIMKNIEQAAVQLTPDPQKEVQVCKELLLRLLREGKVK